MTTTVLDPRDLTNAELMRECRNKIHFGPCIVEFRRRCSAKELRVDRVTCQVLNPDWRPTQCAS